MVEGEKHKKWSTKPTTYYQHKCAQGTLHTRIMVKLNSPERKSSAYKLKTGKYTNFTEKK